MTIQITICMTDKDKGSDIDLPAGLHCIAEYQSSVFLQGVAGYDIVQHYQLVHALCILC